jgi:hypothetical protein
MSGIIGKRIRKKFYLPTARHGVGRKKHKASLLLGSTPHGNPSTRSEIFSQIFQRNTKSGIGLTIGTEFLQNRSSPVEVNDFLLEIGYHVSISILGRGIIGKYKNLGQALKVAFPEIDWETEKFSRTGKKSIQGWYEGQYETKGGADNRQTSDNERQCHMLTH